MGRTMSGQWRHHRPVSRDTRPPRIIVAEDEPDVRKLVAIALGGLGYEIIEARNGAELLDHIGDGLLSGDESRRPDVIISDVRMPGLTGLEILAGLRQANWPTAIVLMTAYPSPETRQEAERLGADAFFAKPFDIDDLMTAVINMTHMPLHGRRDRYH